MITITCKYCGKTRNCENRVGTKPEYCQGRSCRDKHHQEKISSTLSVTRCLNCGRQLTLLQVKRGQEYCSHVCYGASRRTLKNQRSICVNCGEEFTPKKKGQKCCGLSCSKIVGGSTLGNNLNKTKGTCTQCGQEIDYPIPTGITNEIRYCDKCRLSHERDRSRQRRLITKKQCIETINDIEVYERDFWICKICNNPVDSHLDWPDPLSPSLDHVVPISKGGPHEYNNVQLAHLGCNCRKQDRYEARA